MTRITLYSIYTGPTLVDSVANWLESIGMTISTRGTEKVWIWYDGPREDLTLLMAEYGCGWTLNDIWAGRTSEVK